MVIMQRSLKSKGLFECMEASVSIRRCREDKCLPVHDLNQRGGLHVSVYGLLLQSEAEVASAALDLVLGLQVVHALGGDAVDGQNQVSHGDATFGRFPAIRQLHRH